MNDLEITREGKGLNSSNLNMSFTSKQRSRSGATIGRHARNKSSESQVSLSNEWIPTEAVRVIQKIKQQFNAQMTETCVSQILYELNGIWRAIMRKETDAIKKKFTN
jgi:hypothetical protein